MKTLGQRLSTTRQARGLSVRELARRAGCAHQTISDAEQDRHEPAISLVRRLADVLEVSECWLAFGPEGEARRVLASSAPDAEPRTSGR